MKIRKAIQIFLISSISLSGLAQEVPNTGILYNTKEVNSLTYECAVNKEDKLKCDFVQTSVRKKTSKEELAERLAKLPEQYKQAKASGFKNGAFNQWSAEECKWWRDLSEIMSGKKLPPKP